MKMAKPSARDIAAADELHWILSAIDTRWGGHGKPKGREACKNCLSLAATRASTTGTAGATE